VASTGRAASRGIWLASRLRCRRSGRGRGMLRSRRVWRMGVGLGGRSSICSRRAALRSGWVFRLLAGGAGRGGSGGARRERRGEGPPAARAVVESTWEAPAAWRGVYAVGYAAAAGSCRWFVPPSRVGFSSAGGASGVVSVNVKGGTGAGRRRVRELAEWVCGCPANEESAIEGGTRWVLRFRRQPGHRYSCSSCGARRPDVT
jgi:hypothetical protein